MAGMGSETVSEMQGKADGVMVGDANLAGAKKRVKLHGRAFYESIGSPKLVLAPMVEQSEFVCLHHTSYDITTLTLLIHTH